MVLLYSLAPHCINNSVKAKSLMGGYYLNKIFGISTSNLNQKFITLVPFEFPAFFTFLMLSYGEKKLKIGSLKREHNK